MFIIPSNQLDLPSIKAWKFHFETILGDALSGTAFFSQANSLILADKWYNLLNKQNNSLYGFFLKSTALPNVSNKKSI